MELFSRGLVCLENLLLRCILRTYSYTGDSPESEHSSDEIACAKIAEGKLLEYIRIANSSQNAVDSSSRCKRRRLNVSSDLVLGASGNEETEQTEDSEDSSDAEDNGMIEGRTGGADEFAGSVAQPKDVSEEEKHKAEEEKKQCTITNLTKKIRKGIEEKTIAKPRKKNRTANEEKVTSEVSSNKFQFQVGQTGVVIAEPDIWLASDRFGGDGIHVALENWLWKQACDMVKESKEMAWKYQFIFSCLRNLRGADVGPIPPTGYEGQKMWRWTRAARVVNSIVDGLWLSWGPAAAFVYEALAGEHCAPCLNDTTADAQPVKNYSLPEVSSISRSRQQEIVAAVVKNLSEDPMLDPLPESLVFHPAGCIAAAIKSE
jgi:hypothetical protein